MEVKSIDEKNLLILKRNIVSTIFEILFPIVLILLCYSIRQAFTLKTHLFNEEEENMEKYIQNKSAIYKDSATENIMDYVNLPKKDDYTGLSIIPVLKICSMMNSKHKPRPIIASIGVPGKIKTIIRNDVTSFNAGRSQMLQLNIDFKEFESVDKLDDYVKDKKYGQEGYPLICFGISFKKESDNKYDYSLHYFDSMFDQGVKDVPNALHGLFDQFSSGPDLDDYKLYQSSGYTYIMKLINEYILNGGNDDNTDYTKKINFGMVAMPYENYRSDPFTSLIGYFIPFFIVIAYMCPLCLYVYRMVSEKENKSKEGMKIMGLGEGTYFLSYFIQYIVISLIDSIVNTIFLSLLLTRIPFYFLFIVLFLWALDVFALIFFFQSFIDRTRVALILSLLIYFVMFFLSMACMSESAKKEVKIILSLFPPVCLEVGIILFGKFESHFRTFHPGDYTKVYTNYSLFIMNLMQFIDFFLYLFLGYYLQNVLPHDFGIKRPWYFLCTKDYWCGNQNKNKKNNEVLNKIEKVDDEINGVDEVKIVDGLHSQNRFKKNEKEEKSTDDEKNKKNFEGEELYNDRTNPDDALRIQNIVKIFGDGKKAVDNVNLNFYKDEIFALLGHNGAGKTTLISMLTGLYEATEGSAFYDGYDILDSNNMDKFRTILGICPQHDVLFDDLTIREHLEMFCIFKGYGSNDFDSEINKTLHDFELDNI